MSTIDTTFKFEPTAVDGVLQDFRTKIETAITSVNSSLELWNAITPDQLSTTLEHNAVKNASDKIDAAMEIFKEYVEHLNECGLAIAQACTLYNSNSSDAAQKAEAALSTMNSTLKDNADDSANLYNFG